LKSRHSALSARQSLFLSASVIALAASSFAVPAFADDQIETVTVTAEKRSENIQTVPLSIVAVSGQTLANAGVDNATQLGKVVPNLQITTVAQSAGVIVRVRGFGAGSNAAIDPDVAPYIDTAYIAHPGAILSSFLDVKTVEVLRGPQGTLFGRNAAMGAISITTNAPDAEKQTVDGSAEIGTNGWFQGEGIVNVPVSDDAAVRVAGLASHSNGYWHNLFDGKNYGERDQFVGRISAKWDIRNDLSWILRIDGANQNGDGLNPAQIDTHTATAAQLAHLTAVLHVFGGTPPTYAYPPTFTLNQRWDSPKLTDSQYGITSDLNWNASSDFAVRMVNSYRDWNDRQTDGDVVFTTLDLLNRHQTFSSNSQSHELQVITPKDAFLGGKMGFTAGLYYFEENYDLSETLDLGSKYCTVALAAKPALIPVCNALPHIGATQAPFSQHAESFAAYAQANYEILPNLELNLGARQTWDDKSGTFQQIVRNPFAGAGILRAPEGPDAMKFHDSRPSWLANLSWHVMDDVMVFATYATGYKSGGFNSAPGATALAPLAKPPATSVPAPQRQFSSETSDDFELGVKSLFWDGKVLLNATLFNTELHNFQDRSFNGLGFVIRNSGDVRSRGFETEGQIHAIEHLNLDFGVAYLDGIYTKNMHAPAFDGCSPAIITPACPPTQNLSGKPLPFAAKWQGNAGFDVNSDPFGGGFTATFAMRENFTTSYQAENTDSPQSIVPGFGTLDARVSLYSPDNGWQLDLTGTNILNKHYFTEYFPQTLAGALGLNNPTTGATVFRGFLGDPASVRLKLSVRF
jgi:iron complex outermembrane receptor protein